MEQQRHQLALLHAEKEDFTLLSQLLAEEPFDVVSHEGVGSLSGERFEPGNTSSYSNSIFGVMVCIRNAGERYKDDAQAYRMTDELVQLSKSFRRIIVLTDSMDETVVCAYLDAGAHHVIPIDDSPRLMWARLIAALREHSEATVNELRVGAYRFDLTRRTVTMDDRQLGLSPREFEFARFLFQHRERIVPIAELMQAVWSLPGNEDARRIDTAACRLRKKMMLNGSSDWHLRRIRQDGYQLTQIGETL